MSEIMEGVEILMEQEDIVEVDDQMILIDKVVKNRIHKGLGALQRPKVMIRGSKRPSLHLKAAFHSSPSRIRMLL